MIIQGSDGIARLATPEDHEWWCPFGIQIELIRLDTQSRKSSASSRKSCKIMSDACTKCFFSLSLVFIEIVI